MDNSGGVPDIFNPQFFNPAVDSTFASMGSDPYCMNNSYGSGSALNMPQMPSFQPATDPYNNNYWSSNPYDVRNNSNYMYNQPQHPMEYAHNPSGPIMSHPSQPDQSWGVPLPMPMQSPAPNKQTFDYVIQIRGVKLDDHDVVTKSDPYFSFHVPTNAQVKNKFVVGQKLQGSKISRDWKQIYRSETIMDSLSPIWKEFTLRGADISPETPIEQLDEKVEEVTMLLEVYDWDEGTDDFIGNALVTLRDLMNIREIHLQNKRRGLFHFLQSTKSGTIHVLKINRKSDS